jgi:hypothetical protein
MPRWRGELQRRELARPHCRRSSHPRDQAHHSRLAAGVEFVLRLTAACSGFSLPRWDKAYPKGGSGFLNSWFSVYSVFRGGSLPPRHSLNEATFQSPKSLSHGVLGSPVKNSNNNCPDHFRLFVVYLKERKRSKDRTIKRQNETRV